LLNDFSIGEQQQTGRENREVLPKRVALLKATPVAVVRINQISHGTFSSIFSIS
jgi:hypothetical protein